MCVCEKKRGLSRYFHHSSTPLVNHCGDERLFWSTVAG
jgi:hypothetical protein